MKRFHCIGGAEAVVFVKPIEQHDLRVLIGVGSRAVRYASVQIAVCDLALNVHKLVCPLTRSLLACVSIDRSIDKVYRSKPTKAMRSILRVAQLDTASIFSLFSIFLIKCQAEKGPEWHQSCPMPFCIQCTYVCRVAETTTVFKQRQKPQQLSNKNKQPWNKPSGCKTTAPKFFTARKKKNKLTQEAVMSREKKKPNPSGQISRRRKKTTHNKMDYPKSRKNKIQAAKFLAAEKKQPTTKWTTQSRGKTKSKQPNSLPRKKKQPTTKWTTQSRGKTKSKQPNSLPRKKKQPTTKWTTQSRGKQNHNTPPNSSPRKKQLTTK